MLHPRSMNRMTAVALLAIVFLSACGGGENPAAPLRVWIMEPGGDQAREAIDRIHQRFAERSPEIALEVEYIPWKGAEMKIRNALLGGIAPDVCELGNTWTPAFAAGGALADLTDRAGAAAWSADLSPALAESARHEGRLYALPWYAGCRALIYRKDLLDAAGQPVPETWADLVECAAALREHFGGRVHALGLPGRSAHVTLPFIWSNGGEIMTGSGAVWTPALSSPESLDALRFIRALAVEHQAVPLSARIWDANDARRAFVEGTVALTIDGPWAMPTLQGPDGALAGAVGVAAIPRSRSYATFAGGSHLVVFEQSRRKDDAWRYLDAHMQDDNLIGWCVAMGFFPGRTSLTGAVAERGPAYMAAFAGMMEHARAYPPIPAWQKFEETHLFETMVQQLFEGDAPETVAAQTESEMRRILNAP